MKIRLLIVDDHAGVRAGMRALLNSETDLEVVGEAANAEMTVMLVQTLRPDVVIMDVSLPDYDGATTIRALNLQPVPPRILVLTECADEDQVRDVMRSRISGYLLKESGSQRLVAAVRSVSRGNTVWHPLVADLVRRSL